MNNYPEQFLSEIEVAIGSRPGKITADGGLHRFPTNGKRGDDSGWYVLHPDGIPAGAFGCWRADVSHTWRADIGRKLTPAETKEHRIRMDAIKHQAEAERAKANADAAKKAAELWKASPPCEANPYLERKGVYATETLREIDATAAAEILGYHPKSKGELLSGRILLVPVKIGAAISTLEMIDGAGRKCAIHGSKKGGGYWAAQPMQDNLETILVGEGVATVLSVREATGHPGIAALSSGNLDSVARQMRERYPAARLVILADIGNGQAKALEAANAVGGAVALPDFTPDELASDNPPSDFNDLAALRGLAAVASAINAVISAPASGPCVADEPGASYSWPEPTPLPEGLPPVHSFDAGLLPEALRAWVMDIAHRMQCPPDFPAVAALVALSSLIGARAVIQPKEHDDWQVVPNLWGAIVGRPGVKKSPALNEALKPLNRLQAAAFELWQAAHEAWELDCKVVAMQDVANEKKAKALASKDPAAARQLLAPIDTPEEPIARRYIVNDATVEKLGELMQQNEWGVLSYRDELYGLLTGLDKQGQEGARAFYLQSYDGNQGYTFDRIMRGTVHIPRVCLSMIGGIQPGKIQEYVRGAMAGGSADDGLLQRFGLTVWPDVAADFIHVDQWPDTPAKQTAWAVFERLAQLQPESDTEPVVWRFSHDAQALFVQWLVPFETMLRGDDLHPAMVSHLAKYRKLIPALALVFALIDTPDSGNVVHERELLRALAWGGDYLPSHANRLYSAAVTPETTNAATLLSKIKGGKLADSDGVILDSFTPRQVAVKHWAGLATPDAVRKAADVLADYDYLRRDVVQSGVTGGRPSDRYLINPAILKGGAP